MFSGLPKAERGSVFDIPTYVNRLMRSKAGHAYVIINIAHSDDFLQLTGDETGVQLDFPLITARQLRFEQKIREVAAHWSLEVIENEGSDKSRFLDINLDGELQDVAATCSRVFREVFNISGDTELVFQHVGLAPEGEG